MISVAGSMMGVPVMPTVFAISPQAVSEDWKGGRSVLLVIKVPFIPS